MHYKSRLIKLLKLSTDIGINNPIQTDEISDDVSVYTKHIDDSDLTNVGIFNPIQTYEISEFCVHVIRLRRCAIDDITNVRIINAIQTDEISDNVSGRDD